MSRTLSAKNEKHPKKQKKSSLSWGRYKAIIIAIACFLVFDLGVLITNFYTSFQIRDDALAINLSGRQRMLSQRTTKSLLTVAIGYDLNDDSLIESGKKELKLASDLFDSTLKAFINGGTITGTENIPIYLKASKGKQSPEILANATTVWDPFYQKIQPVIDGSATDEERREAIDYAQKNNLAVLGYMNDLTNDLEVLAERRSQRLRMVQTVGIILALLNFIFILFKFIRQLQSSDQAVAAANEENSDILNTVHEGLFLLTPDFKVGNQISAFAHELFGDKLHPGDHFFDFLSERVSEKVLQDAQEYIELLTAERVKEQLIQSINPLSQVEVRFKNKLGIDKKHYLMFSFNRALDKSGKLRHLLVTVQDITEKIELEAKLQEERLRSQNEFSMLLKALEADPGELQMFIENAENRLMYINDLLRSISETNNDVRIRSIIDEVSREIHGIKGNAAALNLEMIADFAHRFENEIGAIKNSTTRGADLSEELLSLPIPLGNLLGSISILKGFINQNKAIPKNPVSSPQPSPRKVIEATKTNSEQEFSYEKNVSVNPLDNNILNRLVKNVSKEYNKQVQLEIVNNDGWQNFSKEVSQTLREITVQLLRNAIVHGIELPADRSQKGKIGVGHVAVKLHHLDEKTWKLSIKDDGCGLRTDVIREKIRTLKLYTDEQLEELTDREVIMHIFKPSFSTALKTSMHAGRGSGLDLIVHDMHKLSPSAHLHVSSTVNEFTEFILTFSV